MTRTRRVAFVIAGLVVAGATAVVVARDGASSAPQLTVAVEPVVDPTSTGELTAGGGSVSSIAVPDIAEIPKYSHVAVQATVVDVAPSQFNTPDGKLPSAAFDRDNDRDGFRALHAVTPVTIRIAEVLGTNPQGDLALKLGDTVVVNVPGGAVTINFRQDIWEGMGLLDEPREPGETLDDLRMPITKGFTPGVALDEGANVILFLTFQTDYETVTNDWEVVVGIPRLVIVNSASGAFLVDATELVTSLSLRTAPRSLDKATVVDLARSLDTISQSPLDLDLLYRRGLTPKPPGD